MNQLTADSFPDTEVCVAARDLAQTVSEPFLFNHVCRTYALGKLVGNVGEMQFDEEACFIGCMFHDLGLTDRFASSTHRFEVAGAEAAKLFLSEQGWTDSRIELVWDAIALHTSVGIPPMKRPEIALVQAGAGLDVGIVPWAGIPPEAMAKILAAWPRLGFKNAMIGALAAAAKRNPEATIFTFVADIGEREVDGFALPNACDLIHGADFSD